MQTWLNAHYPGILLFIGIVFSLWLAHRLLMIREGMGAEAKVPRQIIMLALSVVALIVLILESPISDTSRGQLLSLISVVITGVIAISSTTFVANALGGFMLRTMGSFKPGDFIHVGEQFGRVTERGLFHTEIQTEDRDLSTLPNLYLITNPVTVVHSSGTMISSSLSLGYDIPRQQVEDLLRTAAEETGLGDPFVFVSTLGDFSVTYKVTGFLTEVRQLLSAKSNLRKQILDVLHRNRIEIVSPSYMNQRQFHPEEKVIPAVKVKTRLATETEAENQPEDLIFDKAEKVSELEALRKELRKLKNTADGDNEEKKKNTPKESRQKIRAIELRIEELGKEIKAHKEKDDDDE